MTHVPWNSMLYSMEVWCHQMKYHLVPWNSMELWDCHFIQCHATLDFHGIYHGIPWNFIEWLNKKSPSSMGFHGIRRAPLQTTQMFHGIPWNIPWNSGAAKWNINYFHGIPWNIPWNSMELWCCQMTYHLVLWNSMEFHGTLVPPNEVSLSSMEFHGTLRLSFYDLFPWTNNRLSFTTCFPGQTTQMFHGIPWNIPWNSGAAKWNIN